jgi:hypothetical protein
VLLRDDEAIDTVEDICSALAPVVGPFEGRQPQKEVEETDTSDARAHEEKDGDTPTARSDVASNTSQGQDGLRWWERGGRRTRRVLGLPCLLQVRGLCRRIYRSDTLVNGRAWGLAHHFPFQDSFVSPYARTRKCPKV